MLQLIPRLKSRGRHSKGIRYTRECRRFLLAAFLIAVAALNTGNNLIYLIFSLMLSFLLLSYIILKINLSGIDISISADGPIFANSTSMLRLNIRNRKKTASYSIIAEAETPEERLYCGHIPGRSEFTDILPVQFRRRGIHDRLDLIMQSGFPFILFRKAVRISIPCRIIVYPELIDIENIMSSFSALDERGAYSVRGAGDEVYSLRSYQYGDDWRRIHWKASARQDSFVVREYAEQRSEKITILLDNLGGKSLHFEKAVSAAGSLAKQFIESGNEVRMLAAGIELPFGSGREHLWSILDALASVTETDDADLGHYRNEGFTIAVLRHSGSRQIIAALQPDMETYADTI